ncbi:MAG: hypothetical protein KGR16_03525 [Verrucomicrobia bacterium]|nr:hypothetical protein [Verrucomicrobiota bacterium]MDE3047944.1 hypothetical protein [Verrucomicrobiota bacterium]
MQAQSDRANLEQQLMQAQRDRANLVQELFEARNAGAYLAQGLFEARSDHANLAQELFEARNTGAYLAQELRRAQNDIDNRKQRLTGAQHANANLRQQLTEARRLLADQTQQILGAQRVIENPAQQYRDAQIRSTAPGEALCTSHNACTTWEEKARDYAKIATQQQQELERCVGIIKALQAECTTLREELNQAKCDHPTSQPESDCVLQNRDHHNVPQPNDQPPQNHPPFQDTACSNRGLSADLAS